MLIWQSTWYSALVPERVQQGELFVVDGESHCACSGVVILGKVEEFLDDEGDQGCGVNWNGALVVAFGGSPRPRYGGGLAIAACDCLKVTKLGARRMALRS